MVTIRVTPRYVRIAAKYLDLNCGLSSAKTFVGMQKLLTRCYKKIVAIAVAIIIVAVVAFFDFGRQSASRQCIGYHC